MKGKNKRKGNYYLSGGAISGIGGAASFLGTVVDNINPAVPKVNAQATNSAAMTNDSIMNDWQSWTPIKHFTKKDFGARTSDAIGGAIGSTAQGAMTGASIGGPIGGIIGGALGGISSLFGFGKKKKALRKANRKVDEANQRTQFNLNNRVDNIATTSNWNNLANYSAYGGQLSRPNMFALGGAFGNTPSLYGGGVDVTMERNDTLGLVSGLLKQGGSAIQSGALGMLQGKGKDESTTNIPSGEEGGTPEGGFNFGSLLSFLGGIKAYGGIMPITNNVENQLASNGNNIFAYGGQFDNGITIFNEGGTHESNPNGGIFQGMGENGEPNLVEEGEVKWNDYIFSNRIIVPDNIKDFNLPKSLSGKTFADAAEFLQKESKERELDPISRLGLNTNLSRLAAFQEQSRESENTNEFAQGGPMIKPENKGKFTRWAKNHNMSVGEATSHVLSNKDDYSLGVRRMAQFSRNFGGHALGGPLVINSNIGDQSGNTLTRNVNMFDNGGGLTLGGGRPFGFNYNIGDYIRGKQPLMNNGVPVNIPQEVPQDIVDEEVAYEEGSLQQQLYDAYLAAGVDNPQMIKALISQDMLESGNGKSVQGKFNFGNITGGKGYKGKTVSGRDRDADGNKITQNFRSYDSIQDYTNDKIALLKRRYDFDQNDDINTFAKKLTGSNSSKYRYAEDRNYADKLVSYFNGNTSARSASYIPPDEDTSDTGNTSASTPIPSTATNPINGNSGATTTSTQMPVQQGRPTNFAGLESYVKERLGTGTPESIAEAIAADSEYSKGVDDKYWKDKEEQEEFDKWSKKNDLLRYAPVMTNIGTTLSSIFSRPEQLQFSKNTERIGAGKLGNYMKYNPMDFEYLANRIRQQGASTRRAITNTSGGNRATATAGILAADYNLNNALGNAYTQVQDLNNQRRNQVEEFNRGTNMFNIQNDLTAQQANQKASMMNTEIANQEMMVNAQARANRRNAIRDGISTIGTQLGQIGTENRWMKIAPQIYGYDQYGRYSNKNEGYKFGGLMKVYKKKI